MILEWKYNKIKVFTNIIKTLFKHIKINGKIKIDKKFTK